MGIAISLRDLRHDEFGFLTDDADDSFRKMCQEAPADALRRGVMQHGHTMFNSLQLHRLVDELEGLRSEEVTPAVRDVLEAARQAIRKSGYLYFTGD
ncbi:hypothetical protein [Streptomyces silvensis]|uniref:Uncharacterized protein n=1 Tax=Streptomyces silvensis TaxID=1765722 RepID=A0A0W7WZL5_9ACTN|nr:hypothetical protein [Streptomyces silvensis]KUF16029.1 hypothetical protein AT728_16775 [Streptomyces silvensis]